MKEFKIRGMRDFLTSEILSEFEEILGDLFDVRVKLMVG